MTQSPEDLIRQTSSVDGKRIFSVTDVRLPGVEPAAVMRAVLEEPWSWWRHGRVRGWKRSDGGGARFVLWPAWPFVPSQVGVEMAPPKDAEEEVDGSARPKKVMAAGFFGGFDGPGRYEVVDLGGGSLFRSVWDGVAPRRLAAALPIKSVHDIHVKAEGGGFSFPLLRGTGYVGLIEHLRKA